MLMFQLEQVVEQIIVIIETPLHNMFHLKVTHCLEKFLFQVKHVVQWCFNWKKVE